MNDTAPVPRSTDATRFAIRVRGHLADRWSQQFDGFSLARQPDGTSVLSGVVPDQAALHGLLHKVRDLGLPLLSVTPLPEADETDDADHTGSTEPANPATAQPGATTTQTTTTTAPPTTGSPS